ncbi:hypothetical protein [Pseudomonas sp. PD9R]|nr:hypothetical protein [Pseudomonas sp. PD9R]
MSRLKGFISQLLASAGSPYASSDESLLARYRDENLTARLKDLQRN